MAHRFSIKARTGEDVKAALHELTLHMSKPFLTEEYIKRRIAETAKAAEAAEDPALILLWAVMHAYMDGMAQAFEMVLAGTVVLKSNPSTGGVNHDEPGPL